MHRLLALCVLVLAFATTASLQGCGQTGALYLPGDEPPSVVPVPEDEESSTESDADAAQR